MVALLTAFWVSPVVAQENATPEWMTDADALLAAGERAEALAAYQNLVPQHPDDAHLRLRIATIHLLEGRPGMALEAAQTAESLDSSSAEVYVVLGQCLAAVGDVRGAAKTLEAALQKFPQDVDLLELLATVSIGTGKWPQATGLLRELLRIDPANVNYRLDLTRVLLESNDLDAAQTEAERLLADAPEAPLVLAVSGRVALLQGRLDEARSLFERSLDLEPNPDAYGGLGAVYFVQGDASRAVTHLQKAVEMSPEDPDLRFNLGNAFMQAGELLRAEQAYRTSIRLDPRAADAEANLGVLLLNLLRVKEARDHLRRAAQLDSTEAMPHLHLARVARAEYDYDAALHHYRAYAQRVDSEKEKQRIENVLRDVEAEAEASRQARAQGEIHILQLRVPTREKAEAVVARVQAGEDFYTLAEQNSDLAEITGVDAGFIDPAALGPEFGPAVGALKVGELTTPLEVDSGVYVFMRVE
jgi:tetratricopeptide (TPR) repeat protein